MAATRLAENTQEVSDIARELFDRIKVFSKHMDGIGVSLGQAVGNYNKAVGSFERRVLPVGRKLEVLGVSSAGEEIIKTKYLDSVPRV